MYGHREEEVSEQIKRKERVGKMTQDRGEVQEKEIWTNKVASTAVCPT